MMMDAIENHLKIYEDRLCKDLIRQCTSYNFLENKLLESEDIDNFWKRIAPEYLADAVLQVREYPLVSVAWAAYLGMGVAHLWDTKWNEAQNMPYTDFYGDEGFDNMDDHIMSQVLGVDIESLHATTLAKIVQNLARKAVSAIYHENVEPQTKMAYLLFASTSHVMFRIGAAIELYRLGYKFEKL